MQTDIYKLPNVFSLIAMNARRVNKFTKARSQSLAMNMFDEKYQCIYGKLETCANVSINGLLTTWGEMQRHKLNKIPQSCLSLTCLSRSPPFPGLIVLAVTTIFTVSSVSDTPSASLLHPPVSPLLLIPNSIIEIHITQSKLLQ